MSCAFPREDDEYLENSIICRPEQYGYLKVAGALEFIFLNPSLSLLFFSRLNGIKMS